MSEGVRLAGRSKGWPNWTTPKHVVDLVSEVDRIVLDPCSNEHSQVGALMSFTEHGLEESWCERVASHPGLVYVNPPYNQADAFIDKCIAEAKSGIQIIALVAARTDTKWAHKAFDTVQSVQFWSGRIKFGNPPEGSEGDAPSIPSMFLYWGPRYRHFMNVFGKHGLALDLTMRRASFPVQVRP